MGDSTGSVGSIGADGSAAAVPASAHNQPATTAGTDQSDLPNLQNDDPEWDLGDGKKAKRSEFIKRQKDFEKGFYKAAQSKAEVEKKFSSLTKALSRYGITADQFLQDPDSHFDRAAQDRIARQVDESLMDPKEREMTAKERDLAEREEKQKEWEQKRASEDRESRVSSHVEQITQAWAPALKQSGLPANPKTVARMADVMKAGLAKGIKLDANECAKYVSEQMNQEQMWHLEQYQDGDSLVQALGPQRIEMIRKALIAKVKLVPQKPKQTQAETPRSTDGKYIGWGEYAKTRRI